MADTCPKSTVEFDILMQVFSQATKLEQVIQDSEMKAKLLYKNELT